jgi:hypothetical protein
MQFVLLQKNQGTLVVGGQVGGGKPAGDFTTAEALKQNAQGAN